MIFLLMLFASPALADQMSIDDQIQYIMGTLQLPGDVTARKKMADNQIAVLQGKLIVPVPSPELEVSPSPAPSPKPSPSPEPTTGLGFSF